MSALNNNNNNNINEGAVEHGTLESDANQRGVSATLPETNVRIAVEGQADSDEDPDMVPPEEEEHREALVSDMVDAAKFAGCRSQRTPRIFTLAGTLQSNGQVLVQAIVANVRILAYHIYCPES